jgi:hypothetical protein
MVTYIFNLLNTEKQIWNIAIAQSGLKSERAEERGEVIQYIIHDQVRIARRDQSNV